MIPVYTTQEFENAKSNTKLPLKCHRCNKIFYLSKKFIQRSFLDHPTYSQFCSRKCKSESERTRIKFHCEQCDKEAYKTPSQIKVTKHNFCCRSCAVTYHNTHKASGTRRSKLELWLQEQLTSLYPNLRIDYNQKYAINSELDIYIPSLSLAFELNGIFHYEPIYGEDKLAQIENNDNRKIQACNEYNIEICIIDVSSLKYFKPERLHKYLNIITSIINKKYGGS